MNELYIKTRSEWRQWLARNHAKADVLWLVFYKKETGKPTLDYDASVEEALCFGWIDSIIRKLDDEKYTRKFTPRKPASKWHELNKRRVARMIDEGLMTEHGLVLIDFAKESGKWDLPDQPQNSSDVPEELLIALDNNPKAKEFFDALAPTYRKYFIGWVEVAKRAETREKRVQESIALLEQGKKLGLK